MTYCTVAQARGAGAAGTDAEVAAAIAAAERRVDRFTGDVFEPRELTVAATVQPTGLVRLPHRVRSITSVAVPGLTAPLASTAYRVRSSSVPGEMDALELGALMRPGGGDALVAGAEPWNGGWSSLVGRAGVQLGRSLVHVTGSFGWDAPPWEVVQATASLAAMLTDQAGTGGGEGGGAGDLTADDEGNALTITVEQPAPTTQQQTLARSTGLPTADGLLASLVRRPVRFG